MAVDIYLTFNGNCREAVEFYEKVFESEKTHFMTYGENPPNPDYPLPEEAKSLVMHTRLPIDGSNVMFSDTYPGSPFSIGNNISLAYQSLEADKLQNVYDKLKEGGTIDIELQETIWAKLYGKITDKYGVIWQFNLNSEETSA